MFFIKENAETISIQFGNSANLICLNTFPVTCILTIFNVAGFNSVAAARIFHKLMERLGFSQYYLQGGDWGALITSNMAQMKPE